MRLRGSPVLPDTLLDVSGTVPASAVQGLLAAVRTGQFSAIQEAVTGLIADGYPAQEILLQLQSVLLAEGGTSDAGEPGPPFVGQVEWPGVLLLPRCCRGDSCL